MAIVKQIFVVPFQISKEDSFDDPQYTLNEKNADQKHFDLAVALSGLTKEFKKDGTKRILWFCPKMNSKLNDQKLEYLCSGMGATFQPYGNLFEKVELSNYCPTDEQWQSKTDDPTKRLLMKEIIQQIDKRMTDEKLSFVVIMVPTTNAWHLCWELNNKYTPTFGRACGTIGWGSCFSAVMNGELPIIHWNYGAWYAKVAELLEKNAHIPQVVEAIHLLAERLFKVRHYDLDMPAAIEDPVLEAFAASIVRKKN